MFKYNNHILHAEGVSIKEVAKQVATPFYCYSYQQLIDNYYTMAKQLDANQMICFAVKSNSNISVLNALASCGSGADCVSSGEIKRALMAGIKADKIVFSGVGKSKEEIEFALASQILQFNVESVPELYLINQIAETMGVIANIAIRVNPDVAGNTHKKITTGTKGNKFGIDKSIIAEVFALSKTLNHIKLQAISTHIGSQILSIEPFRQAFNVIKDIVIQLRQLGHQINSIDLGGGVGISYHLHENQPDLAAYIALAKETARTLDCNLILEPGRFLVANIGILVSKIIYIKENIDHNFIILDAGMNDLLRPSLYDAYHQIIEVKQPIAGDSAIVADIVGPVCESSDIFASQRSLSGVSQGDLLAFRDVGAYGASMSSCYNSRSLIAEVMIKGQNYHIVRKAFSIEQQLALEKIPEFNSEFN